MSVTLRAASAIALPADRNNKSKDMWKCFVPAAVLCLVRAVACATHIYISPCETKAEDIAEQDGFIVVP